MQTTEELFDYLGSFVNFERRQKQRIREFRLDRMRSLLDFFENPEASLPCIHIAGSKGKGSTGAFLAQGLQALGIKTGLYSSPHVSDYRERITQAGAFFPDQFYISEGNRLIKALPDFARTQEPDEAEPTAFELLTLLAFMIFRAAGCGAAVIETGIGGRLDATNVIQPLLSVITPIELEHSDVLGRDIAQIASEKAGIIKEKKTVFVAPQRYPEALEVFRRRAGENSSRIYYLPEVIETFSSHNGTDGSSFEITWKEGWIGENEGADSAATPPEARGKLRMMGVFQSQNAALALSVIKYVIERQLLPSGPAAEIEKKWPLIVAALSETRLPGRLELVRKKPPIVLDGAHTPVSVSQALETFKAVFGTDGICIFGAVEGKDIRGMAGLIGETFDQIIISTPGHFKPNAPEQVQNVFGELEISTHLLVEPSKALQRAFELSADTRPILVIGSFYMAAEIRNLIYPKRKGSGD
ncbi:MAG TPA: bifunctional folylpolyglutamate synthase/dihydrofolate synthase [Sediminispirochaeta sp.]|nr:bifunctional folylpolyglutamate synthase/dihydrofolate synthase [Sediminispirochaeta sp.]